MPSRRRILLLALGAALAEPCRAIIGGSEDGTPPDSPANRVDPNTTTSPWAGVGSLSVVIGALRERAGTYTATALDARHVITAAHVVAGRDAAEVRFNLNYGEDLSHRIDAAAITVHPDYAGHKPDARSGIVHDDLAIVRLGESLPFGVPFYTIRRTPVRPRTVITLVGYGASGDGVHGRSVPASPSVKRVGRNVIDAGFRDSDGGEEPEVYLFDFDGPDASANRLGGGSLGNHIEATVAGGDSGSPALVRAARGRWQLVGVNTFVAPRSALNQRFGGFGGGVLLYPYVDWVNSVLAGTAG
ncbi:MAG: trypsin-like serine peptidase [Burkholderiales bacterium]